MNIHIFFPADSLKKKQRFPKSKEKKLSYLYHYWIIDPSDAISESEITAPRSSFKS